MLSFFVCIRYVLSHHQHILQSFSPFLLLYLQVAYTRNAVCEKNGHGSACSGKDDEYFLEPTNHQSMIERAQEFVDKTNLAYITSKINFQLRLVHTHFTGSFNDAGYDCGTMIGSFRRSGE